MGEMDFILHEVELERKKREQRKNRTRATREDLDAILYAIDEERGYQDATWTGERLEVGEEILVAEEYLAKARTAWQRSADPAAGLNELRKVAAIVQRCFEHHGCPRRMRGSSDAASRGQVNGFADHGDNKGSNGGGMASENLLARFVAAKLERELRILLAIFETGLELYSKTEISASLAGHRFRCAMARAEVDLFDKNVGEVSRFWDVTELEAHKGYPQEEEQS